MRVDIISSPFQGTATVVASLLGKPVVDVVDDSSMITITGGVDEDLDKMWKVGISAIVKIAPDKRGGH